MTPSDARRPRPGPLVLLLAGAALAAAALLDLRVPGSHRAELGIEPGSLGGIPGLALAWGAAMVLGHDPRHRLGWVLGAFGVWWSLDSLAASWLLYATAGPTDLPGASVAHWFYQRAGAGLLLAVPLVLLLYPDGRFPTGRARLLAWATIAATALLPLVLLAVPASVAEADAGDEVSPELAGLVLDPVSLPVPDGVWAVALRVAFLALAVSLVPTLALVVRRYRRATGTERTRMRWLLWAAVVDALVMLTVRALPGWAESAGLTVAVVVTVGAVVVGVTRPQVVDVDRLLGGTLVYAALLGATLLLDLLVLGVTGRLLGERLDSDQALVLAVFLVAAAYGPLRHRLWRLVRTRVLGERGDRYTVVSDLAERLEESPDPDAALLEVARAVAVAFRSAYVGVELWQGAWGTGERLVAEHGRRPAETQALPISYRGERIGRLLLPVGGVTRLRRADERLLADVVRQAAAAARADRLAADLQTSRERLVSAVADERRRLRRELHDGLGPALAGVATRIDTARITARRDPARSEEMLRLAREEVTGLLTEVRRLVHGLRPPALDDVGLVRALGQAAEQVAPPGLTVAVEAPDDLGPLPAAVEVAVYRIVTEALTNVVRHAGARTCTVTLAVAAGGRELAVRVGDDGRGIAADVAAGVGLVSMRERAEELGGRLEVRGGSDGGTVVAATLPLPAPTLAAPERTGGGTVTAR